MKNKIQEKIYAIFQTLKAYASKLRISSFVGGQFKDRQTFTNKILNMITRSNKKAYKENNQFLLTISGLFVALTLANTQFNPTVQGKDMFIMTVILISSFPLFILFNNRQADRHREYHRKRMNFLFDKMSEDEYRLKIIKPEILEILKTQYVGKVNEYSYDTIADDIFKKYRSDLEKPLSKYQNKFNFELLKLKINTLTDKYEWEYQGTPRAWFDFLIIDLGRYGILLYWVYFFLKVNIETLFC